MNDVSSATSVSAVGVSRRSVTSRVRRRTAPGAFAALALSACVIGSLALSASAGAATRKVTPVAPVTVTSPLTPGSTYLSLGDSVTFGFQESTVVPAPNYHDASSFLGYPEQLGAALHMNIINPACPGETSASLINDSAPSNGCENSPSPTTPNVGYRTMYPLHVRYKGSQLAFAVGYLRTHRNVRLVSLMIGANDLFLCQETTSDACQSSAELSATIARAAANIRRILSAIRNQAHYRGQLAIVNYYSLNYASSVANAPVIALNQAADTVALPFHAVIADGFDELKAASVHSGSNTCVAGLLTQLGSPGTCGIHPSYAGQALLAQALEKVVRF
jgi:lysophospholipase L1-like esterase